MNVPSAPQGEEARQKMRFELQLSRSSAASGWSAELMVPGTSGRLTFPTLKGLLDYLSRLDRPPSGLR
jgi:hypothetical protein